MSTENTKEEEQLEEDSHYREERSSSTPDLLTIRMMKMVVVVLVVVLIMFIWIMIMGKMLKKDMFRNVIDACKVIRDPLMEAKEYYYKIKKKAGENIGTKRKEIGIAASEKEEGGSML